MSLDLRHDAGRSTNIMTTSVAPPESAGNTKIDPRVASSQPAYGTSMSAERDERGVAAVRGKRKTDKKSPEYLIKSGLAGGFAGCAVCALNIILMDMKILTSQCIRPKP